jgi:hypothetical protein
MVFSAEKLSETHPLQSPRSMSNIKMPSKPKTFILLCNAVFVTFKNLYTTFLFFDPYLYEKCSLKKCATINHMNAF